MGLGESDNGDSISSRRSRGGIRRAAGSSSSTRAPPVARRYRRAGAVVAVEGNAETQTSSTGAGFHAEAGRSNGDKTGYYASSNGSSNSNSDSDSHDLQNGEDCSTPRPGPSRLSDHDHRQLGHNIHIHDELGGCCSSSLSSSTASSRYYGSSNTSPASPPFAALKSRSAVHSRPGSPPSSYRAGSPAAADEEEFVSRVRAGLDPKSKPFPSSSSSTTPRHGGARRSLRGSTTPRTSRPSTRRHSRRNSTSADLRPTVFARSLPSLSPEAVQQLITVSLYTLVTIVAGVALIGILAGSYALSVGDDLKDRLIEAKLSAAEAVELAKQEALKIKVTLEKRVKQVGDSWNVPATEEDRPNYRELFGHLFQQVTPPFIYSISLYCFQASSATYSTVCSIYHCATRKRNNRSKKHYQQDSSTAPPPRPPLKSLIPSLTLAVLLASFAFVRNTSFWQSRQQKTAVYSTAERRRASKRAY